MWSGLEFGGCIKEGKETDNGGIEFIFSVKRKCLMCRFHNSPQFIRYYNLLRHVCACLNVCFKNKIYG